MQTAICVVGLMCLVIGIALVLRKPRPISADEFGRLQNNLIKINTVLQNLDAIEIRIHKILDCLDEEQRVKAIEVLEQCKQSKQIVTRWKHLTESVDIYKADRQREHVLKTINDLEQKVMSLQEKS